jgi:23S rRNA (cytosine1962-C5)-methyltransferase
VQRPARQIPQHIPQQASQQAARWWQNLDQAASRQALVARLQAALAQRAPLLNDQNTCFRLINGIGDGFDHITVDYFGAFDLATQPSTTADTLEILAGAEIAPRFEAVVAESALVVPPTLFAEANTERSSTSEADFVPQRGQYLGVVLVLSLYRGFSQAQEAAIVALLAEVYAPLAIYLKRRPKEARKLATTEREHLAPEAAAYGQASERFVTCENGLRYLIRPGSDLSVGLFLDMRETRAWLGQQVKAKTVLNTFAYTCAFGVVASNGKAARVVNLDLSRRVLDWGNENYQENGLVAKRGDFISGDVFDWLTRLARRQEQFEVVILDPPSFATVRNHKGRSRHFAADSNYHELVAQASHVVAAGGLLLACCNHAGLGRRDFLEAVGEGLRQAGRRWERVYLGGQSPLDFPLVEDTEAPLKVLALRLH